MAFTENIENNFAKELSTFFSLINKENFHLDEKYVELIDIITRNNLKIGNPTRTIEIYRNIYDEKFDDWQDTIYTDISCRLEGFCPDFRKIDLTI